jgi:hypothetical protein
MKKKLFIFVLLAAMFFVVAGFTPASFAPINRSAPNLQASTPTPSGQITVPSVSIQLNAPGPNPMMNTADAHGHIAGILMGIWHGIISPVTLVWSFVNPKVQMYEVHNDGSPYNLGYLIGVAILFVLIGLLVGSRRR